MLVWRQRQYLYKSKVVKEEEEYAYYVTSLGYDECTPRQLLEIIRGHWGGVENGSHYRRDVSLGEDSSQIRGTKGQTTAAHVMASLRNLVLGLFEHCHRDQPNPDGVPSWCRQMTGSEALWLVKRVV